MYRKRVRYLIVTAMWQQRFQMYRNCNARFTLWIPVATAATFARNVVHHGILALFQILLGLATFSIDLSRPLTVCGTDREGSQVV